MPFRFVAISILCFLAPFSGARAEEVVQKAPAPAWVADYPVDLSAKEPSEGLPDGSWILLNDDQTNGADATHFQHYARKYTTQNAIRQSARIEAKFNPAYETLTWHKLVIHRGEQVIDLLANQKIRVLSREENLEEDLYDGTVTAVVEPEGLRVGDVLEYSYSTQGSNPIFSGKLSDFITTTSAWPIHQLRIRLLWPASRPFMGKERGKRIQSFQDERLGEMRDKRWSADDLAVVLPEASTPVKDLPLGWLQFSEYETWQEVIKWGVEHFRLSDPLPPELQAIEEKIRLLPTEEEQILAALEYVQDQIRYLSVSEGVHSHLPYTIEEVMQRGFGDCKDKARLLCVMLRNLGFDASPVLVATSFREGVANWLPTPEAFDHAVVRLKWKGATYWLDATASHQRGGLADRFFPAYGKALVLEPGGISFTTVDPSGYAVGGTLATEDYDIPAYNADVKLTAKLIYRGFEADTMRAYLENTSPDEIGKTMLNFRARLHPGIRAEKKPSIHDDPKRNEIIVEQVFTISNFWQDRPEDRGHCYADFYASSLYGDLEAPSTPRRDSPLSVTYPANAENITTIHLPDDSEFSEESKAVDDPAFTYRNKVSQTGRTLTIHHIYKSLRGEVPLDDLGAYLQHQREAREMLDFMITVRKDLTRTGATPAPAMQRQAVGEVEEGANWLLVGFAFVMIVLTVAGCALLYMWEPRYMARPREHAWEGLGGWLILLAIFVCVRPLAELIPLSHLAGFLKMEAWAASTTPGQPNYHSLWGAVVFYGMAVSLVNMSFGFFLVALFFQKRRSFPILMGWMLALTPVFLIVDAVLSYSLPAGHFPGYWLYLGIGLAALSAGAWIPYLLTSRRVAATFVNGGRRMGGRDNDDYPRDAFRPVPREVRRTELPPSLPERRGPRSSGSQG